MRLLPSACRFESVPGTASLQPLIQLAFTNSLAQASGPNNLVPRFDVFGGTLECTNNSCANLRTITGGYAQPVPEPETYALMLAGLAGLGFMVRRKKAATLG